MSALSDSIEEFIKALMSETDGHVDLRRNELATYFSCAPSQINYVLATRFSIDRGYIIESRRGGGGYIRVVKMDANPDDLILNLVTQRIEDQLTQTQAHNIVLSLLERGMVSPKEAQLMIAACSDKALAIPAMMKDKIRAQLLKTMLIALLNNA